MIRQRRAQPIVVLTRTLTDISLSPTHSDDGEKYDKRRSERSWIVGFRLLTILITVYGCYWTLRYESASHQVVFVNGGGSHPVIILSDEISIMDDDEFTGDEPDYGDLEIRFLKQGFFQRRIHDNSESFEEEHEELLDEMDEIHHGGTPIDTWQEVSMDSPDPCVPSRWTFENHQACNSVHELTAPNYQHLGSGYYRDAFLYERQDDGVDDHDFVMKKLLLTRDVNQRQLIKVNNEALVMEKLSSTGLVGALYGHCGTTVLVERGQDLSRTISNEHELQNSELKRGYFANKDLTRLNEDNEGFFQNNELSPEAKLNLALAVVQSIALLHGYHKGVIAHDDISLDQWMLGMDNRVILNDFNSIRPLTIDRTTGQYCKFRSRSGNYKAPEYYATHLKYVTEASDIWPVGLVLYTLLTGLMPYHAAQTESEVEELTAVGTIPLLNPILRQRSFIEKRIADAMDRCLVRDPNQRVDIFWVVDWLRETQDLHRQHTRRHAQRPHHYR